MSSQFYSKIYRGFLIEQTAHGWIVPQLPTWSNGPVPQGPFGTYPIACHVLDRVLDYQAPAPVVAQAQSSIREEIEDAATERETYDDSDAGPMPLLGVVGFILSKMLPIFGFAIMFTVVLIGGLGKYSTAPYLYGAVATIDVILIATIYYTLTRL